MFGRMFMASVFASTLAASAVSQAKMINLDVPAQLSVQENIRGLFTAPQSAEVNTSTHLTRTDEAMTTPTSAIKKKDASQAADPQHIQPITR